MPLHFAPSNLVGRAHFASLHHLNMELVNCKEGVTMADMTHAQDEKKLCIKNDQGRKRM